MPTKPQRHEKFRNVFLQHWTREEQIANAKEDGMINEIKPPLTPEEMEGL